MQGRIWSFDQLVVWLGNRVNRRIYKQAISTIVPACPIRIPYEGRPEGYGNDPQHEPQHDPQNDFFGKFIELLRNGVNKMIYKHAISTIVPARPIRIPNEEGPEGYGNEPQPDPQHDPQHDSQHEEQQPSY